MEGEALPTLKRTSSLHEELWEAGGVQSQRPREGRLVEDGDKGIWQCIYIPHVSRLTKVIDRQTESFCHTKFSTAASCPVPSSPKVKNRKISCSIEGTHGFPWVNNSFSPVLVIPTQAHNVRLGGIKSLGQKNK